MRRQTQRWSDGLSAALVLTAALLAFGGRTALAHEGGGDGHGGGSDHCRPACSEVKGVCKEAARSSYKACTRDCRASLMPEACFAECRAEYGAVRDDCKVDCRECRDGCNPGGGEPSACEQACMAELEGCAAGLRAAGRECAEGCAASAREAFESCFENGTELIPCLLQATRELGGCLGGCAHDLREGADACREAAGQCREDCQGGSASRAFLQPSETLFD